MLPNYTICKFCSQEVSSACFFGFSHRKKLYKNPGTVGGKGRGAFLVTGSLVLSRWWVIMLGHHQPQPPTITIAWPKSLKLICTCSHSKQRQLWHVEPKPTECVSTLRRKTKEPSSRHDVKSKGSRVHIWRRCTLKKKSKTMLCFWSFLQDTCNPTEISCFTKFGVYSFNFTWPLPRVKW